MAISFVRENDNAGSSGSLAVVMPGACAVGDLLIGAFLWGGASSDHAPAASDTINTGSWVFPTAWHFKNIAINQEIVFGYIQCDHPGTPTINGTSLGSDFTFMACMQYTGFVATATPVTADTTTNSGTGTAISGPGFTNSFANELILYGITANNPGATFEGTVTGGYTNRFVAASALCGDQVKSTSGNSITMGATQPTSQHWGAMLISVQDVSAAPAVFTPYTRTNWFHSDTVVQM